jgi:hypothetical protein
MATAEILDGVADGTIDAGLVRCPPVRDGIDAHGRIVAVGEYMDTHYAHRVAFAG